MPLTSEFRRVRTTAYVIATLVLLVPLMEIAASAWPYSPGNPQWRMSVVTAAAGASTAILLALLLIYVIGTLFGDRPAIRLVAWICALMSALCVVAAGSFVLDALQLRGQVLPDSASRYNVVSSLTLAKIFLVGSAALVVAVNAFRTGRHMTRTSLRHANKSSPLIVGSSMPEPSEPLA